MNPRELDDEAVVAILDKCVELEFRNEAEQIDFIREVMDRKLWVQYGANSMFDFLVRARYQYPNAVAQRKLNAARLMGYFAELKDHMFKNEINLTQVEMLMSAVRQVAVPHGGMPLEKMGQALEAIRGQNVPNSQVILCEIFEVAPKTRTKVRVQRDGSVRMEITFSKEQWEKITRVKEVVSHIVHNGELADVIEYCAEFTLSKKDPCTQKAKSAKATGFTSVTEVRPATSVTEVKSPHHVSRAVRKFVFRRDKGCRHQNEDGTFCGSRYQHQIDHIVSRWRGGGNNVENLQVLCGFHNRLKYEREIRHRNTG